MNSSLTILHGDNAQGKTSILAGIAAGLGAFAGSFPNIENAIWKETDIRRDAPFARIELTGIELTPTDDLHWISAFSGLKKRAGPGRKETDLREVQARIKNINLDPSDGETPDIIPIFAYYDTDRAVLELPQRRRSFQTEFPRIEALSGALTAKTDFHMLFEWFHAKENEELREQRERHNFEFKLPDLEAVRRAITGMIPGTSTPRIEINPLRFIISLQRHDDPPEPLSLAELSGGYRIMLALVADLARRMAQANPHLEDPLKSEAVVLIDEIDLHLHPRWQQTVLNDLQKTFPNTQFIVSTHSPQVLSSARPEHILRINRDAGDVRLNPTRSPTFGAESGDVMEAEMGVRERPDNEFTRDLKSYMALIEQDKFDSEEAKTLRLNLEELSPRDYGLDRADVMIRRRKAFKSLESKP